MIQGTGSYVGKSLLATGLCRVLSRRGIRVAPFKSQNMALNSFVTPAGHEIGMAQAIQAEAAGIEPTVEMNPILLKPSSSGCQVVVLGKPIGNMNSEEYFAFRHEALRIVREAYVRLCARYEVIIIEGAGSPAEINLKARDVANMATAELADSPVILVTDIDRGGAFAWVVGTLALLDPDERARVKGIVFNKFRGRLDSLAPGLRMIEERTGIRVVGVLPFDRELTVGQEDGVWVQEHSGGVGEIVVVRLPHISNFTDFDPLRAEIGDRLSFAETPPTRLPRAVILPGTKNTIRDLRFLRQSGWADYIRRAAAAGTTVVGICGGFQMLGRTLADPHGVEACAESVGERETGRTGEVIGLEVLPLSTVFLPTKATYQIEAESLLPLFRGGGLRGYEIHMGETTREGCPPAFRIRRSGSDTWLEDGAAAGSVWGTYIHGLFENDAFRAAFLEHLGVQRTARIAREFKETQYDRLADSVAKNLDMGFVAELLGLRGLI